MDNKYKKHMIYLNKMDKILFCFFFEKEETMRKQKEEKYTHTFLQILEI